MKMFRQWHTRSFQCGPPGALLGYLKDHPDGSSGRSGFLHGIDDIIAYTEERGLLEKGVLYLGAGNQTVFLMRAVDGKVFLASETDFQKVEASFKDLDICRNLLDLD